jgi:hypothetical protein
MQWRRWACPPGPTHIGAAIALTLIHVAGCSEPAWVPGLFAFNIFFLVAGSCCCVVIAPLVLVIDYALHAVTALVFRRSQLEKVRHDDRAPWRWLVLPVGLALALSARATQWPLHARFDVSRAALQNAAQDLLKATPTTSTSQTYVLPIRQDRWIGWYYVVSTRVSPDLPAVEFITGGSSITWWGFVWDPGKRHEFSYQNVAPDWYVYVFSK